MTPKSKKYKTNILITIDQVDDDIESVDQKAETALADFEDMDRWKKFAQTTLFW